MNRGKCGFCGEPLRTSMVDLGATPLSNSFIPPDGLHQPETHFPLHAFVCDSCLLVQVEEFEAPENIFDDYSYFSSFSESWLAHCSAYAADMVALLGLNEDSLVVEVASNDGYLLQYFKEAGVSVMGIEPAHTVAEAAIAKGIPTRGMFFNRANASQLRSEGVTADLIAAKNVLAHVPDIGDFVAGFKVLLQDDGVITVEFPHLLNLIEQLQFDTIYHEHFSYLSLSVVRRIFAAHGLRVFDVKEVPTHGGSLRIFGCHEEDASHPDAPNVQAICQREEQAGLEDPGTYHEFQRKVVEVKSGLLRFLINCSRNGQSVVGYGAPAKGNTLLNYCGVGPEYLPYTVDKSPHKQGCFLPGSRIPIFGLEKIAETRPDYVLILPWNLEREIRETMSHIEAWGGKFVIAIPEIEIF